MTGAATGAGAPGGVEDSDSTASHPSVPNRVIGNTSQRCFGSIDELHSMLDWRRANPTDRTYFPVEVETMVSGSRH
ncbi:MAG: hypothetical protein KC586_11085, partial [Myxococcales bacterium]|nr:hypothetical protein [Myxococcales bacterium]